MKAFHDIRHSSLLDYINSNYQAPTSEFSLAEKGFSDDWYPCPYYTFQATHADNERQAAALLMPEHRIVTTGSTPEAVPSSPLQQPSTGLPGAQRSESEWAPPPASDATNLLENDMTPACQAPAPAATIAVTAEPPALPGAGLWPLPEPAEPPPLNMTRHIVFSRRDPFHDDWLHW